MYHPHSCYVFKNTSHFFHSIFFLKNNSESSWDKKGRHRVTLDNTQYTYKICHLYSNPNRIWVSTTARLISSIRIPTIPYTTYYVYKYGLLKFTIFISAKPLTACNAIVAGILIAIRPTTSTRSNIVEISLVATSVKLFFFTTFTHFSYLRSIEGARDVVKEK